ncbi:MAG: hypothetical protein MJ252_20130 [archaeon]|nr:hypothetical protein [archaeon]
MNLQCKIFLITIYRTQSFPSDNPMGDNRMTVQTDTLGEVNEFKMTEGSIPSKPKGINAEKISKAKEDSPARILSDSKDKKKEGGKNLKGGQKKNLTTLKESKEEYQKEEERGQRLRGGRPVDRRGTPSNNSGDVITSADAKASLSSTGKGLKEKNKKGIMINTLGNSTKKKTNTQTTTDNLKSKNKSRSKSREKERQQKEINKALDNLHQAQNLSGTNTKSNDTLNSNAKPKHEAKPIEVKFEKGNEILNYSLDSTVRIVNKIPKGRYGYVEDYDLIKAEKFLSKRKIDRTAYNKDTVYGKPSENKISPQIPIEEIPAAGMRPRQNQISKKAMVKDTKFKTDLVGDLIYGNYEENNLNEINDINEVNEEAEEDEKIVEDKKDKKKKKREMEEESKEDSESYEKPEKLRAKRKKEEKDLKEKRQKISPSVEEYKPNKKNLNFEIYNKSQEDKENINGHSQHHLSQIKEHDSEFIQSNFDSGDENNTLKKIAPYIENEDRGLRNKNNYNYNRKIENPPLKSMKETMPKEAKNKNFDLLFGEEDNKNMELIKEEKNKTMPIKYRERKGKKETNLNMEQFENKEDLTPEDIPKTQPNEEYIPKKTKPLEDEEKDPFSCENCEPIYKLSILNNIPLKVLKCLVCGNVLNNTSLTFYHKKYQKELMAQNNQKKNPMREQPKEEFKKENSNGIENRPQKKIPQNSEEKKENKPFEKVTQEQIEFKNNSEEIPKEYKDPKDPYSFSHKKNKPICADDNKIGDDWQNWINLNKNKVHEDYIYQIIDGKVPITAKKKESIQKAIMNTPYEEIFRKKNLEMYQRIESNTEPSQTKKSKDFGQKDYYTKDGLYYINYDEEDIMTQTKGKVPEITKKLENDAKVNQMNIQPLREEGNNNINTHPNVVIDPSLNIIDDIDTNDAMINKKESRNENNDNEA